jgi:hypothetical protein
MVRIRDEEGGDMDETSVLNRTREACSEFGDEFADIAHRFRENYESISDRRPLNGERAHLVGGVTTRRPGPRSCRRRLGGSLRRSLSAPSHDERSQAR